MLRQELAVDPDQAPYLEAYLARVAARSTSLETLLYRAHQLRARWATPFDPERIAAAARAFARLSTPSHRARRCKLGRRRAHGRQAVRRRLRRCTRRRRRFDGDGNTARFLAALDVLVGDEDLLAFVAERLERSKATELVAAVVASSPTRRSRSRRRSAQLFVPPVAARLDGAQAGRGALRLRRHADAGRATRSTARAAPSWPATLRRRFKLAIVDEFQDTDQIQWEIFRTIFDDAGRAARSIWSAIPSRRSTASAAPTWRPTSRPATAVAAAERALTTCTRNFRSTRAVIDAYNAILDQTAAEPFFNHGDVSYDPPVTVRPRRRRDAGADADRAPVTLLRVTADEEVARLPMRAVREGLAQAVASGDRRPPGWRGACQVRSRCAPATSSC